MDLLTIAKNIADRVEAESLKQDMPVAVTVIDIHGNVVLTHRTTGARAFSLELSEREAYTSALVACAPLTSSPRRSARPPANALATPSSPVRSSAPGSAGGPGQTRLGGPTMSAYAPTLPDASGFGEALAQPRVGLTRHEVMTAREVADLVKMTVSTIYQLARKGELPASRLGRTWRFVRPRLEELLAA